MPGQLSLFPVSEVPERKKKVPQADANSLDEMFEANRRFREPREYARMMLFIAHFPKYSAFNGLLLYLQNPLATYVATAGTWLKQFGRSPLYQATPLMILAPMSPVLFVYDVADTEGEPFPERPSKQAEAGKAHVKDILEKTTHNCNLHGIAVHADPSPSPAEAEVMPLTYDTRKRYMSLNLDSRMKYLILLDREETLERKYESLARSLGHVFCGHVGIDTLAWWPERKGVGGDQAMVEAESVSFLACYRQGLTVEPRKIIAEIKGEDGRLPPVGLNAVFHSTHYIEQMGKAKWQQPKKQSRYQ